MFIKIKDKNIDRYFRQKHMIDVFDNTGIVHDSERIMWFASVRRIDMGGKLL